jgi:hypothetical protein
VSPSALRATLLLAVAAVSLLVFGFAMYSVSNSDGGPTGFSWHEFAGRDGDIVRLRNEKGGISLVDLDETPTYDCRVDCSALVGPGLRPVSEDERICLEADDGRILTVWVARAECFDAEDW